MANVVKFYERLPQGPAPEAQGRGILGRYAAKHFNGKNASGKRTSTSVSRGAERGRGSLTRPQLLCTPLPSSWPLATPRTTTSTSVSTDTRKGHEGQACYRVGKTTMS
jgi:F1-F0 ATP synthase subunit F-like protein